MCFALDEGIVGDNATVMDAGNADVVVAYPDDILRDSVNKMLRNNIGRLPVVSREDNRRIVGYLGRANLMSARSRQLQEEDQRERGLNK